MFKTIFPKELVWAKIQETPKCLMLKLSIKNLATVLKFKNTVMFLKTNFTLLYVLGYLETYILTLKKKHLVAH